MLLCLLTELEWPGSSLGELPKPHPTPPHPGTEHFLSLTLASTSSAPFLDLPSPHPTPEQLAHPESSDQKRVRIQKRSLCVRNIN